MLAIAPGVLARSSGSEMVLLEPSTEQFFGLEGVGARIFELLREQRRFSDLVDILLTEYDIDRATLENDVWAHVEDMVRANLLRLVV
ncbi:PqqD family protein [Smaragdicoccus niigatensis]